MLLTVWSAILTFSVLRPALGAVYTNPFQLPSSNKYDYVVIGAGVGGSVIASRLSEDPCKRVLVIEAGPSDVGIEAVQIPFFCVSLSPNTPLDWNYTTVAQAGLNGRTVPYPRGRLVGGSSSINYMFWNTGTVDDFNRLADVTGDPSWNWERVHPLIRKIEKLTPPADHHNTTGQIDPSIHGKSGPVGISLQGFPTLLDDHVMRTTSLFSSEFPYNHDMNSGNPIGIGWSQFSIANGTRVSAGTAYLEPALASRSNIDLLVNTQVTKIFQTGTQGKRPIFRGVQFAASGSGPFYAVNATHEVILSAGAVATPQLLQLSGIGDPTVLRKVGIEPLVNLPDVGKNLQDHTILPNVWAINASFTPDDYARNATALAEATQQWETSRTGQLASPPAAQIGWFRLPDNSSILKTETDPSAGPTSPHYEFVFADVFSSFVEPTPATGHYMVIATNLISPSSRGSVTLNSSDPFEFPIIDPAFLSTDFDIFAITEAVKAAQRFMAASPWQGFVLGQFGNFANVTTDEQIAAYARNNAATVFHPVGTAFMSAAGAKNGVVNPDFTVKSTIGLRVVDASIFPYIPSMHPQGSVYIVAERAAAIIRNT
ncbi:aryl-alcohol-oxidase from pleurotus Eryingii [Lactarius hengduanensis]|nr:aryl-alcohol-oxidase from pleurotus Eryingii [Lactarius hengduanensis]